MKKFIKKILYLPEASWLDNKDAVANYKIHREIISRKSLLRSIYDFYFSQLIEPLRPLKGKKIVEIGAGGWNLSQFCDGVLTSDIAKNEFVDMVVDAQDMPFKDSELNGIVLLDVLHHIPSPSKFFSEASRVLKTGGYIVMIEPYLSPFSRFVYSRFHHEPCDEFTDWDLPSNSGGRLVGSNLAMPYNIFMRDREKFEKEFPGLRIEQIDLHTCFVYLLSGGLSMRNFVPGFLTKPVMKLDKSLRFLYPLLASQMTIILKKQSNY